MTPTTPAKPSAPADGCADDAADDLSDESATDELWMPFRSWLETDPTRRVLVGAVALLTFQAVVRGYVALGGWFLYDDYAFVTRAATMHLWSGRYLFEAWNGHVMPGAFVWVHLLTKAAPLDYAVVALTDVALQAVVGYLVYRLLTALFGRRPVILVPLAVFLFTPITLPAGLWWAAALNQLPGQAFAAGALLCQVTYHRRGRTRSGVAGALCILGGLLFSEKMLLVVPAIFALTLLWFTPGRPVTRLRRALRENRPVWLAYGVVVIPYAVWYLVAVPSQVTGTAGLLIPLQTVGVNLVQAVLPALAGGPYGWTPLGVGAIADPPPAVMVVSAVLFTLGVAWTVLRRHRAVFGWVVVLSYWLLNALILGVSRAGVVGPVIGREYRYTTDVALIVVVFGSLTLLSVSGDFAKGTPQRLRPRGRGHASLLTSLSTTSRSVVVGLVVVGFVTAASLSTFTYDAYWRNTVTPRFVATARSDMAKHDGQVVLADLPFPAAAAPQRVPLTATTRFLLALPAAERPSILADGQATDRLSTLDDVGHLRDVAVDGFANRPGPEKGCGYLVGRDPVRVPLQNTTMPWAWFAEIGYLASMEADTTVTVGSVTTPVHVAPGINHVFVLGGGAIDAVTIDGLSYGTLCTDDVHVGFARPVPGTGP